VIGVESHPETIALAKQNAALNHTTATFHQGQAETLGVRLLKELRPDTLLCNPPRTGLDPKLLNALCSEKPPCILYVSCMPSTLARDLKELIHAGYTLAQIQAFDMFPQTTHVETLVKLVLRAE
jgi:23S rRNA (uracil1939-C5)-methyltransferase